jgi:hypothetical protein
MLYKHRKSGNLYRHLAVARDTTDGRGEALVVVYCPNDDEHTVFVREQREFETKFAPVGRTVEDPAA